MARLNFRLLLLTLLTGTITANDNDEEAPIDPFAALDRTLRAVEDSLDYLKTHIDTVNLDGLIGSRATEGELGNMLAIYWTRLPISIVKRFRQLQAKAAEVNARGIDVVQHSTPVYYSALRPILSAHFWDISLDRRPLQRQPLTKPSLQATGSFTEQESDDCLQELFGHHSHAACNISVQCWKKMTHPNYAFYSLTHQVFYLLNAVQSNCFEIIRKMSQLWNGVQTERQIMDQACADIFQQAKELAAKGPVPLMRDLFMEEIALCGKAGYLDIAQWKWLPLILSWQRNNGCYGTFGSELHLMRYLSSYGTTRKRRSIGEFSQLRRKRVEKVMTDDGCLSHRTSVAVFALTTYMRRLTPLVVRQVA